jgi:hypothetical protein
MRGIDVAVDQTGLGGSNAEYPARLILAGSMLPMNEW